MIAEQPLSLAAGLSYDTLDEGDTADAGIVWTPDQGWRSGIEVRATSRVLVNDAAGAAQRRRPGGAQA